MTDEKEDIVDRWIVTKKKTGYPIAILNGELEKLLGVPHFPFAGVLDPDGTLAYAGDSPEAALKKAMKTAKPGSIYPKKVLPVELLLRTGKLADAWTELQSIKSAGSLDEKEAKSVAKFEKFITDTSSSTVKAARDLVKKDFVFLAVKKAEGISAAKPPLPATDDALKMLGELKAMPTYDAEMKGGEAYAAGRVKEDAQEYIQAIDAYKDVVKKYEGTKIAGVATKEAQDLIARGMPGYAPACEKCVNGKKACEKHAKPVKL